MGYVDMAQEDLPRDSITYANLGKVMEGAHRGQDLVARILSFSRRQHHELLPLHLEESLMGVLALLKPTIPASVTIQFTPPKGRHTILGNATQLHQVFVNLINNAVDAMDGEGTIQIEMSRVFSHDELLEQFPDKSHGNYCKIDVSDTGHGMGHRVNRTGL